MKKNIYITGPIPEGKNGLTSRANYVQRTKYEPFFYNLSELYTNFNYLDLRYEYANFCKIDISGEPINISEAFLKNLNDDIYAVNFVVDAFNELKTLCSTNENIKDEKFKKLKAKRGWSSLHKMYHDHMKLLFNEFIKKIEASHKDKKIDSLEKFIIEYMRFTDEVIYKTPFLKSSYLLSKEYPQINTGFIIEIDTGDASNDNKKFKDYFMSYEYNQFVKLCEKTNFLIDKNCPWRLIYNTFSDKSEQYMKKYDVNKNNLIEKYFYKTQQYDLENLKQYMIILYNSFVDLKPKAQDVKVVTYNEKQTLSRKFIERKKLTIEEVNSKFGDQFWFNIYCHIFFVENKLNLNYQEYLTLLKNMNQTFSLNGFKQATIELKNITKNTTTVETKGEYTFKILTTT
jgi:hypothetical protein